MAGGLARHRPMVVSRRTATEALMGQLHGTRMAASEVGDLTVTGRLYMPGTEAALTVGETPPTAANTGTGLWLDRTGLYILVVDVVQFKADLASGFVGIANYGSPTTGVGFGVGAVVSELKGSLSIGTVSGGLRVGSLDVGVSDNCIVADGTITGTQLISNIAIGTAPLVVTSTTKVSNLNVEQVDGHDLDQDVLTTSGPTFDHVHATNGLFSPRSSGAAVFALDTATGGSSVTLAVDATATPTGNADNFSGLVILNDIATNGYLALFMVGSATINLIAQSSTTYSATKDNAGTVNLYYATGVLTIQNKTAGSRTMNVMTVRTRASS